MIILAFSDSSIAIFIIVLNSGLIGVLPGISYQLPSLFCRVYQLVILFQQSCKAYIL